MRTAITIGKTHEGKWLLIATPDENMIEQRKSFRTARAERSHPKLAVLHYQENDGFADIARFVTPEVHAKNEAQKAKDHAEFAKQFANPEPPIAESKSQPKPSKK